MCIANAQCVELLKHLPLQEMIIVTGAGPSSPGCCTTKELVDAVAAACRIPSPPDLTQLAEFYQSAHDANADHYYATIKDKFSPPFVAEPKLYRLLVAVGFRGYITFDYEDLLPQAMLKSRGSLDGQFTYYPQPKMFRPYDLHSQRLVAIHGFADPNALEWEKKLVLKTAENLGEIVLMAMKLEHRVPEAVCPFAPRDAIVLIVRLRLNRHVDMFARTFCYLMAIKFPKARQRAFPWRETIRRLSAVVPSKFQAPAKPSVFAQIGIHTVARNTRSFGGELDPEGFA